MNKRAKLLYGLVYLLSLLPLWVHYLCSDVMYLLVYKVLGYRVKVVRQNLSRSFPEKTEQERRKTERLFYKWLCDYAVETIKLTSISHKQIRRRLKVVNAELVNDIIKDGQSCAAYLGHYCNWEWITSLPLWTPEEAQCGQIYHAMENGIVDQVLLHVRQRLGAISIPMAETLRQLLKFKSENRPVVIGYIADQVPFWNNIHHWCQFLNQDTPVLTGTERLARKLNHAVLYMDLHRPKRGYYEVELKLITRTPQQMGEYEITDAYFQLLEQTIKREPQYWLWSHKRWKRTREEFNLRLDPETGKVDIISSVEELKAKRRQQQTTTEQL
jgi:KDO2-lipid IV(A) lauroyltransferase